MDAMEPIRIHVVREPGRAANAGHENDSFARDAEFGITFCTLLRIA